jgi:hypothetical protein
MPHYSSYQCSECKRIHEDGSKLVRKRVDFIRLGKGGKMVASRTVAWLCETPCMEQDSDYQRKAFDAPGMKSPSLERVRAAKENGNGQAT